MSLKELTWENHKKVERTVFVKRLLKKHLSQHQYYVYLCNLHHVYVHLEGCARQVGVLEGIEDISRASKMNDDMLEMESSNASFVVPTMCKATYAYIDHLNAIKEDYDSLLAHVYVRHMGDLSGGQIIKKYVPGPSTHYEFDCEVDDLKARVREKLHDGLATEANLCFEFVYKVFDEIEVVFADMESPTKP
jgi:heme oxygenase